jgi:NAD(P)-dependent dehydrogenase (short-subunit alcohol dehydrogenase family)
MDKGNILVIGASTGIGRACAIRFAEFGYRVFAGVWKCPIVKSAGRIGPAGSSRYCRT